VVNFFIFRCGWFTHLCLWCREGRGPVAALYDIPPGRLISCTVVRDCGTRFGRRRKKGGEMVNRV